MRYIRLGNLDDGERDLVADGQWTAEPANVSSLRNAEATDAHSQAGASFFPRCLVSIDGPGVTRVYGDHVIPREAGGHRVVLIQLNPKCDHDAHVDVGTTTLCSVRASARANGGRMIDHGSTMLGRNYCTARPRLSEWRRKRSTRLASGTRRAAACSRRTSAWRRSRPTPRPRQ